jgi:hypothetical protein
VYFSVSTLATDSLIVGLVQKCNYKLMYTLLITLSATFADSVDLSM